MIRRGCCGCLVALLGLLVVAAVAAFLVGRAWLGDKLRQPLQIAVGTQIARQFAPAPGVQPAPGTYVIGQDDLNTAIRSEVGQTGFVDDAAITLAPSGFDLRAHLTNGGDVSYRGNIAAVDGRLRVTNLNGDGMITAFLPPDQVRQAIENAVNDYLVANGLRLADAALGDGTLTLTTAASP